MTPSRKHLFALLGLALPIAAFTASPGLAATSSPVHHKTHHASTASHKAKPHHSSVHNVSHHASRATPHRSAAG